MTEAKTKSLLSGLAKSIQRIGTGADHSTRRLYAMLSALKEVTQTGTKLRRSLAPFDTLNRLAAPATQQVQDLADAIAQLGVLNVVPPGIHFLDNLPGSLIGVSDGFGELRDRLRENLLAMAGLGAAAQGMNGALQQTQGHTGATASTVSQLAYILHSTGQQAQLFGVHLGALVGATEAVSRSMGTVSTDSQLTLETLQQGWQSIGTWFSGQVQGPISQSFRALWQELTGGAFGAWESTKQVFSGVSGFFESTFSTAWNQVKQVFSSTGTVFSGIREGVLSGFKNVVNTLIDGINNTVSVPFTGIKKVLNQIKKFKIGNLTPFAFLDWFIQTPKIPHLAQGAVLPANKPFMAVVGDQHHGTNVEAPLQTITDALRIALEDTQGAQMAGQHATVELLGRILEAVRGIHLTDATIAAAADRHHQKQAVMFGIG